MCAIHGFTFQNPSLTKTMVEIARHRGPDGEGYFSDEYISMAHNLLAITDSAEKAHQPWTSTDNKRILVYNGEIYNYSELRAELEISGAKFTTNSDTEVLFKGIEMRGVEFLNAIDGMYGFAWYNAETLQLILARDRSGTKPLFYNLSSRGLCFSSELRSLLSAVDNTRKLDRLGFSLYMAHNYVPGPKTLISGVSKLVPGQWIKYCLKSRKVIESGSVDFHVPFSDGDYSESSYQKSMRKSVERCLTGQRTIGINLSGGFDSSVILHEASRLGHTARTFTTRYDIEENIVCYNSDADLAARLSKKYNTCHEEVLIDEKCFADALEDSINALEQPHANWNIPAYYLHMKKVSEAGIVVLLGGEGGDEILAGYSRYKMFFHLMNLIQPDDDGSIDFFQLARNIGLKNFLMVLLNQSTDFDALTGLRRQLGPTVFRKLFLVGSKLHPIDLWFYTLLNKNTRASIVDKNYLISSRTLKQYSRNWNPTAKFSSDILNNQMHLESQNWLTEEALIRMDKLGMAFGMESRFPFVANPIRNYCNMLPSATKITEVNPKRLVKLAYNKILPDYILGKKKTGWSAPHNIWMKSGPLYEVIQAVLNDLYYPETKGLFNFERIKSTMSGSELITILNFQIWAKQFKISL